MGLFLKLMLIGVAVAAAVCVSITYILYSILERRQRPRSPACFVDDPAASSSQPESIFGWLSSQPLMAATLLVSVGASLYVSNHAINGPQNVKAASEILMAPSALPAPSDMSSNGTGGDQAKATTDMVKFFKLAAEQGKPEGQVALGRLYEKGDWGLAKDDKEAARLYRMAAEKGNPDGQVALGRLYEAGDGGLSKDDKEAARLYRQAAEQGNPDGQVHLARFYQEGRGGLKKNKNEAMKLFIQAEKNYRDSVTVGASQNSSRSPAAASEN